MHKKKDVLWDPLGAMANKMLSAKIRELQNTRPKATLKASLTAEQLHRKWRDWAIGLTTPTRMKRNAWKLSECTS
jgi:hypothetical protein